MNMELRKGNEVLLSNMDILVELPLFTYAFELEANVTMDGEEMVVGCDKSYRDIIEAHRDYYSLLDDETDNEFHKIILEIPEDAYGLMLKCTTAAEDGRPEIVDVKYNHRDILDMRRKYLDLDPDEWLRQKFVLNPLFKQYMKNQEGLSWEQYSILLQT